MRQTPLRVEPTAQRSVPIQDARDASALVLVVAGAVALVTLAWIGFLFWLLGRVIVGW